MLTRDTVTVRELFEAFGQPVLQRCRICLAYDGYYSEYELIESDCVNKVIEDITLDWWTVENPPYRNWEIFGSDGEWQDPGNMMSPAGYHNCRLPDMSRLPAIDAYEVLPELLKQFFDERWPKEANNG